MEFYRTLTRPVKSDLGEMKEKALQNLSKEMILGHLNWGI